MLTDNVLLRIYISLYLGDLLFIYACLFPHRNLHFRNEVSESVMKTAPGQSIAYNTSSASAKFQKKVEYIYIYIYIIIRNNCLHSLHAPYTILVSRNKRMKTELKKTLVEVVGWCFQSKCRPRWWTPFARVLD